MEVPPEYYGREQSYLKHRVLREYLELWGRKLGSTARKRPVRLWYVDCFAGPWKSRDENLADTSIEIGLSALEEAGRVWEEHGHNVGLHAVFVEKEASAFATLEQYLADRRSTVDTHAIHGKFGEQVEALTRLVGNDPAFVFIDPTGFKGVAMDYIRPLLRPRMRDVLVNVMFNDINRFKDDERTFLREQMRDFFGTDTDVLEPGLDEASLLRTYRRNLKTKCGLSFAADLAIPHPTQRRTWFRLVIGGKHPDVLDVFRRVERKVVGDEASAVRTAARERKTEIETGQLSLLASTDAPAQDPWYEKENRRDREAVIPALLKVLTRGRQHRFGDLWPPLLEEHHVTRAELARLAMQANVAGRLLIEPDPGRRQTAHDTDLIALPKQPG